MLYFKFKNYEEFKEDFGIRNLTRKNNILLSFLKHEMKNGREVPNLHNLNDMYHFILNKISGFEDGDVKLMNKYFFTSDLYETDDNEGLCNDGDTRSIRYVRKEDNRLFKMRAGKFLRKLLMLNEHTCKFCKQAIIYVCETFSNEWTAYAESKVENLYTLKVNYDFDIIYDSDYASGFNSCMNDKGFESFYLSCVNAKAASLWNGDSLLARCVIFTEAYDCNSNKVYRLAERQYAADQDDNLKQILVNKLIEGGYIDGYKKVGASCHDPHMFILNDGTSISNLDLYIKAINCSDNNVPYMDSFKYFNINNDCFYNSDRYNHTHLAENIDGTMDNIQQYDEYHERYCNRVRTVYAWNGNFHYETTCDEDDMEDFTYCDQEDNYYENVAFSIYNDCYIPQEYSVLCKYRDDYVYRDDAKWCETMQDWILRYEYETILSEWLAGHEELAAV